MIIRILVIGGVVWFCIQNGYPYAALFILAGGIIHYIGWFLLIIGCGILFYNGEWIVGVIPLLWAFVWEIWGPKLIGKNSIAEEMREMEEQEKGRGQVLFRGFMLLVYWYGKAITNRI